ncbi:zinc-binding dehydrogenase [Leucobacter insecticola]|uniref:Zinc-binding dehydrogenase n=1 Tax=Leucobacter insecticola TaxID=2714934 RepID=A0A6G8FG41_9MICO|nr:zinc-binding dehydrogenase [Leucobacter insecticola]QIM15361.1 zinc-binding dehydrogenase [Leucobacter insecticola]
MFAHTVTHGSGSGTLRKVELATPRPGPGQLSIDVDFAGLGLIDAFWTSGVMPSGPEFVPGLEASGTVRELGEGVTEFAVGDPVAAILLGAGGFAEVVCVPAAHVAAVPEGLGMEMAAVVAINTVTAHLALTRSARFSPSDSMLVQAGVGGLGSQFARVALALGITELDAVVGTEAKRALAQDLGYRRIYLRDEIDNIPAGAYDLVVDPVGGVATEIGFRALRSGGRLVRVGNASQAPDVPLSSLAHWLENKTTTGFNVGAWLSAYPEQCAPSLQWSLAAAARGDVRVDLTRVGTPEELPEMLASLERGETTGKLAVRMVRD